MSFLLKVAFTRILVSAIGIGLYIYLAVNFPQALRVVQEFAQILTNFIAQNLPDNYAVLVPLLGLENILTGLMIVLIGVVGIEYTLHILKRLYDSLKILAGLK